MQSGLFLLHSVRINTKYIWSLALRGPRGHFGQMKVFPAATFDFQHSATHSQASRKLPFEVDTKVEKDVILFKYENAKFFRWLNLFGLLQYAFWLYLAHFSLTVLRDAKETPVPLEDTDNRPFWKKFSLGENKYRNGMVILCLTVGNLIVFTTWMFTLRSIRYIVLRKGGQAATIVTHAPFGRSRYIDVPLDHLSCMHNRSHAKVHMSLKIKGRWMFFLIDKNGTFLRPQLFDQTVGLMRTLK